MAEGKQPVFSEPTRLVLTEAGSAYFLSQNQRLQRFRLLDQREEYGLQLSDYPPKTLSKLVNSGMVRKLEFPVFDAVERRQTVIDYIKILAYGLIYRHGTNVTRDVLLSSELASTWNRQHPRQALGEASTDRVQQILTGKRAQVEQLRSVVATRARAEFNRRIKGRTVATNEEREKTSRTVEHFVDAVPPEAWFLLLLYQGDRMAHQLVHDLAQSMARLLEQVSVADYLSLMMLELMVHMQHRQSAEMTSADAGTAGPPTLYLLAQYSNLAGSRRPRTRLHFVLSTGSIRFEALKADLDQLAGDVGQRKRSIDQFYSAASSGEADLGLYYTSFLEDACSRLGVAFDQFARGERDGGFVNVILTV